MIRVFTKATGRYPRGLIADYPKATWDQIASSAALPLEAFTATVEEVSARAAKTQPDKQKVA